MPRIRPALVLAAVASLVIAASAFAAKVTGGTTTITPSAATTTLLSNNHITVTPIAPATVSSAGALTFPILHGRVNAKTLHGDIVQSGGLKLSNGTKTVDIRRLAISSTKRGTYIWGMVRGSSHRLCTAVRRHLRGSRCVVVTRYLYTRLAKVTSASVSGTTVTGDVSITQATAGLIDRLAGSKVVSGGAPFGTISIAATVS